MAVSASAYHIKLNGNGFILVEGSYVRRSQQAFNPRFSTGDPGYGDLSFWQFITQSSWEGGAGQKDFSDDSTKYLGSCGFDFRSGKPKLSVGFHDAVAWSTAFTALAAEGASKIIPFAPSGGRDIHILVDGTQTFDASVSAEKTNTLETSVRMRQLFSRDAVVWHRAQVGSHLACLRNNGVNEEIRMFTSGFGVSANVVTASGADIHKVLYPMNGNSIAMFGDTSVRVIKLDVNAWTISTNLQTSYAIPGASGIRPRYYAVDSAGTVYIAHNTIRGCAIVLFTTTDLAHADGPRPSDVHMISGFAANALSDVDGTVYIFGNISKQTGLVVISKPQIRKFPNTVVWEGQEFSTVADVNYGIHTVSRVNRGRTIFFAQAGIGTSWSLMALQSGDVVQEQQVVEAPPSTAEKYQALLEIGNRFIWYDGNDDTVNMSEVKDDVYTPLSGVDQKPILKQSIFSSNTRLIKKSLYSVSLRLSQALPASKKILIKVNGTEIGSFKDTNGTEADIILTTSITASTFQIELTFDKMSWNGEVEELYLRYVPVQFKKKAWGLAVRADLAQELINGQRETRSPKKIFEDLEAAWETDSPIQFIDKDGREYKVLITEFLDRSPLLSSQRNDREGQIALELLEA